MGEHDLRDRIKHDRKLMNKLSWEAENGKTAKPEEAAQEILSHPHRSARFWKLFPGEDPKVLLKAVTEILRGLKDGEA